MTKVNKKISFNQFDGIRYIITRVMYITVIVEITRGRRANERNEEIARICPLDYI